MTIKALTSFAVMLLLCSTASAQYKCTGKDGSVAFQQTPCSPEQQQKSLELRQPTISSNSGEAPRSDLGAQVAQAEHQRAVREAIAAGRPLVGMTQQQLQAALGQPNKVNAAQYGSRAKDQLIYYRHGRTWYVYVDNGVVSAIQDTDGMPASATREYKPCPSSREIRDIEIEINKLANRDNQRLQVELHKQLSDARACR